MKTDYWKMAAIGLAGLLLGMSISGRQAKAYGGYKITDMGTGPYAAGSVAGDVVGFSCVSVPFGGSLDHDGDTLMETKCYAISK